jgi:uncharacterized radical SAM superfamily protein
VIRRIVEDSTATIAEFVSGRNPRSEGEAIQVNKAMRSSPSMPVSISCARPIADWESLAAAHERTATRKPPVEGPGMERW